MYYSNDPYLFQSFATILGIGFGAIVFAILSGRG